MAGTRKSGGAGKGAARQATGRISLRTLLDTFGYEFTDPEQIRRIELGQLYLPPASLALSIPLALFSGPGGGAYTTRMLALAAAAAVWTLLIRVPQSKAQQRRVRAAIYFVGLVVFLGVLVAINPFFGFYSLGVYPSVSLIPGRTRLLGLLATGSFVSVCQVGGFPDMHGLVLIGWGVLVCMNLTLSISFTYSGYSESKRTHDQTHAIDTLGEANQRLEQLLEENAGLHAQLVVQAREAGIFDERQRMAGEIHDTLAQGLTGILAQLEAADLADGVGDAQERRRHLRLARDLARASLSEARRSVQALRPGPLERARLPEALAQLGRDWEQTSGVPVRLEVDGEAVPLQPALEVVLYRSAQEALANIAKHARAEHAGITVSYTPDLVLLDVLDDGFGFEPGALGGPGAESSTAAGAATEPAPTESANGTGYGLEAMRRRLMQVGGGLVVESAPGEGTTVSASVPALRLDGLYQDGGLAQGGAEIGRPASAAVAAGLEG